jgi:hypothetical protein
MPGLRIRRETSSKPDATHGHGVRCRIPTLIKRATGASERYALSAIRALPLRYRGKRPNDPAFRHNVVLQASDGHQAVCVLTEGAVEEPVLIPGDALPSRLADRMAGVTLDGKIWKSKNAEDVPALDEGSQFPPIGPVLPEMWPDTVAVAIDVDRLRRVAAGLGTDSVTLLVPRPKKTPGKPKSPPAVRDPIGVCAAGKDDTDGVAVMMPVDCERSQTYFKRVRDAVLRAEQPERQVPARQSKKRKEVAA